MAHLLQTQPWLAVAVPLALAVLVALGGRSVSRFTAWIAMLGPLTVLAVGVARAALVLHAEEGLDASFTTSVPHVARLVWLVAGERALGIGHAVDGLVALMLMIVGTVAFAVMLFSVGYMAGDPGYARYYAVLSLFTASMAGLVVADGLLGLFVAWELVGACSYLLIGFWYRKPAAAAAAVKAFLVTRVGDVGLLLAIALLWRETGSLSYVGVMERLPTLDPTVITVAALLMFVGAAGKSAQFPLHIWLPDAMEGPTPVSALIHAATMVAAGVFLVARTWPLFEASDTARAAMLAVATFTALGAATVAVPQTDIKKVLAYSTISQLGFMFAALGAAAWHAAMFHLATHAAFKALLFLAAGSYIHGTDTQDLREMGGLGRSMPITSTTWVIGGLALAGVVPFSGFFSKDAVIHGVWLASPAAAVALLVASACTAFYVARTTRLALTGRFRGDGHPHEGGWVLSVPLVGLAVPAALLGLAATPIYELLGAETEGLSMPVAAGSTAVALVFLTAGWMAYASGVAADESFARRLGGLWRAAAAGYGADPAVRTLIVRPFERLSAWAYDTVERRGFDGAAEGTARLAERAGASLAKLQSGDESWYVQLAGAGFLVVFALAVGWPSLVAWLGG